MPSDSQAAEALQLLLDEGYELVTGTFVPDCIGGGSYKFLYQADQCCLGMFSISVSNGIRATDRSRRIGVKSVDSRNALPPSDETLAVAVQSILEEDNVLVGVAFVPDCITGGSYKIFYQFRQSQLQQRWESHLIAAAA